MTYREVYKPVFCKLSITVNNTHYYAKSHCWEEHFLRPFGSVYQSHNKHWKQSCPHIILTYPWPSLQGNWTDGNGGNIEIRHSLESSYEMLWDSASYQSLTTWESDILTSLLVWPVKSNRRNTVRKELSYQRTEGCENQTKFKILIQKLNLFLVAKAVYTATGQFWKLKKYFSLECYDIYFHRIPSYKYFTQSM